MLATEKNLQIIQQINKIETRIDSLNLTKSKLFQFLLKVQELYQSHSQTIQTQIENFEDLINKKSIYSVQKCLSMKKLAAIYKRILIFVEGTAKLNQIQLEKIDIADQQRQEKLLKKAESFLKSIHQYNKNEQGFNKNFQEYNSHCLKLDQMISKFKQFQNPIVFYNVNVGDDYSKRIDRKHHQCENKETSLVGGLQLLDQKRKILSQNIKEIQENFIRLLHYHITNITDATSCLTERGQDEIQILPNPLNFDKVNGDIFTEQIEIFDNKYGKICAGDEILTDLKELFGGNSSDAQITSDERLFLDRCEGFTRNKTSSVEEFIYLQKRFIQQIHHKVLASQKLTKEFTALEKAVFKSNGLDDFKKRVRKYFGEGILNITELCFIIIDVPKMRIEKIGKFMQSYYEKLQKCLDKKEEELKRFKKRVHQVFHDHHKSTKGVQNNFISVNEFKSTIEKSFSSFRNYFGQLCKNQSEVDVQFQKIVKQIIKFVEKQELSMKLPSILNKQKEKFLYDLFKNFVLDSEIVDIVKEDTRYEILFNDCLKPNLFDNFESRIPKKEFEETKIILQKKQYQSKGMLIKKSSGWCGLRSKTKKYLKNTDHNVNLIQEGKGNYSGILEVSKEGICFEEKKKIPFSDKISIRIPKNGILSYQIKVLMDGQQRVQILTPLGPVYFLSDETAQILKSFEDCIQKKQGSKEHNDSRRDRSRSNDSSSFSKQNNSSTEYKVSFEKTAIGSEYEVKDKNRKSNEAVTIKKLIESLRQSHFVSELFTVSSQNFDEEKSRIDYKFKDNINKFLLKQKRIVKVGGPVQNSLFIDFNWKVSFPQMQMLKSFTHGEEIKISLTPMLAKIIIIEKNRGENFLFLHKVFYNEVDKMNKKLSDLVVSITEREAEVIIEQEQLGLEDSTLNLDIQNLGLEKSQIQSKDFNRTPNGSLVH